MARKKAVALFIVLATILLITILCLIGLSFMLSNVTLSNYVIDSIRAFSYADAGVQKAMYEIRHNPPASPETLPPWSFGDSTVKITIAPSLTSPGTYTVTSEGTINDSNQTIQATVAGGPPVKLLSWQQLPN